MNARIVIQSGISAGLEYWISRPVTRIGSDPESDLVIPSNDLAGHALTIEHRHPDFRVYNRGGDLVSLGGQILSPESCKNWIDTDLLELPGGVVLALELESISQPISQKTTNKKVRQSAVPVKGSLADDSSKSDVSDTKNQPSNAKAWLQIGVTILCLVGCGVLLWRHKTKQSITSSRPAPAFSLVIRKALDAENVIPASVVKRLQDAEAAHVRGQRRAARAMFLSLHDSLSMLGLNENVNAEQAGISLISDVRLLIENRLAEPTSTN